MYTIKNILVTTDFSEYSASAIEYAQSLGAQLNATIHLVHVLPDYTQEVPDKHAATHSGMSPREAASRMAMNRFIDEHVDEYTFVEGKILTGRPAEEILRYAEERKIDCIIIATHGRTGLAHVFLGSVAESIVRKSKIPVLTVKPRELSVPFLTSDEMETQLHLDAATGSATMPY